jgi:membrane protein
MKKLINLLKLAFLKSRSFINNNIWKINLKELPWYKMAPIKLLRTFILAYRGFNEDKVNLRASALTYFSILSVVPIIAMAFGIAKGFGFDDKMQQLLQESLKGQEDIATWLIDFATNMLDSVKGGWIFGIGLVFLLWTVMQVLSNIENAFNSIWQVKHSRVFFRKFSDYFSIMMVAPILILVSSSSQVFIIETVDRITNEITFIGYVGPIIHFFVKLVPYVLVWMLFTFIYMVMPNTKVKFGSALIAGIIAGTVFQVLQWGYIHFQIGVSRYNTIYGSFAALPLFLVWLNYSWLIVLFGAEISFSAQNHHQYEYESDIKNMNLRTKRLTALYILNHIVFNFESGKSPLTAQAISKKLKLPVKFVRQLIYELIECEILAETPSKDFKEPAFLPAKSTQTLTLHYAIEKLNNFGLDYTFLNNEDELLTAIETRLNAFEEIIEKSDSNDLLVNLGKSVDSKQTKKA